MKKYYQQESFKDIVIGLIIMLLSSVSFITMHRFVYGGTQSVVSPLFFPKFVVAVTSLLSLILVISGYLKFSKRKAAIIKPKKNIPVRDKKPVEIEETNTIKIIIYVSLLFVYFALLYFTGFLLSTPFVMLFVMAILGNRNYKLMFPLCIVSTIAIYYFAFKFMKVLLPSGILFD